MKKSLAALGLLSLLLSGCQSDQKTTLPPVLTTVLPTPATPGQTVVVYGRLPTEANQVTLTSSLKTATTLTGQAVKDGLQLTLPATLPADLYTVTVAGMTGQSVTLDVVPRLDRLTLSGNDLTVQGAGWGSNPAAAIVEVNGQRLAPQGDAQTLKVTVNKPQATGGTASDLYGVLNVRVLVAERASETKTVSKEAVSVKGTVSLPVGGQTLASQAMSSGPRRVNPTNTLLMPEGSPPPLTGLLSQAPLGVLHRQRVVYDTVSHAQTAYQQLQAAGLKVEYDQLLQVQNSGKEVVSLATLRLQGGLTQWQWPLLGLTDAWKLSQGQGITVAVIDTGVLLSHPDLQGSLLPGWDFVDNDADPTDQNGHGTHVAGLIAAHGSVSGAAPAAQVLPVRVIGPNGGSVSDLVRGLLWAAGLDPQKPNPHPAQIINMSLGTPEYSDTLQQAVQQVLDAGVIVVAATGNDGGLPYAPANIPGVIAVTSVAGPSITYQPSYANRGPGTRIAAYGGDLNADQDGDGTRDGILSTDIDASGKAVYALRQGTSMATPEVSGIAALLLAQGTPSYAVKALLEGSATDLGVAGMDLNTGWGLVNAKAMQGTPDLYVAALDDQNRVITYLRPVNGQFTLQSLPPNQPVKLIAGTDRDHNGVIGEAGELLSAPLTLTVPVGQTGTASLALNPSDGKASLTLPR